MLNIPLQLSGMAEASQVQIETRRVDSGDQVSDLTLGAANIEISEHLQQFDSGRLCAEHLRRRPLAGCSTVAKECLCPQLEGDQRPQLKIEILSAFMSCNQAFNVADV